MKAQFESLKSEKFATITISPQSSGMIRGGEAKHETGDDSDSIIYHCTGERYDLTADDSLGATWTWKNAFSFVRNSVIAILLLCIIFQTSSYCQTITESPTNAEYEKKEEMRYELRITLDSLFELGDYSRMLQVCASNDLKLYEYIIPYNRIAAYYFSGDTGKAFQMIDSFKNASPDARYLTRIMTGGSIGYNQFLSIEKNKEYVLRAIVDRYKMESPSDMKNGCQVLLFCVWDQRIRATSQRYVKLSNYNPNDKGLLNEQETNFMMKSLADSVYQYYRKVNKFFTQAEIKSAYSMQTLMFYHDFNMEHRKFYADLMEEAIKRDSTVVNSLISFKISSELYEKYGNGFINAYLSSNTRGEVEKIIDKYKKEYGKPDFFYNPIN